MNAARSISLAAGTTGTIDTQSHTVSIAGPISGSGSLAKIGTGTLTLANTTNTHEGGTTISQGILSVTSDSSLGTSASISMNGGTLRIAGTSAFQTSKTLALMSNSTIDVSDSTVATWNGAISGSTGLTKSGAGTLTLTGDNNLTTSNGNVTFGAGAGLFPSGRTQAYSVGVTGSGTKAVLSGGAFDLSYGLSIGGVSGTPCSFQMNAGTLTCGSDLYVGSNLNQPSFSQSGGTATTDTLRVGVRYTSVATYNLSGTAELHSAGPSWAAITASGISSSKGAHILLNP